LSVYTLTLTLIIWAIYTAIVFALGFLVLVGLVRGGRVEIPLD